MFWNKKPEPVITPIKPKTIDPQPEDAFYRIGIIEDNRVSFSIGNNVFNQLFLNKDGCVDLCNQLMAFANALDEETQDEPKPTSPV
jgi:hypothetical protein